MRVFVTYGAVVFALAAFIFAVAEAINPDYALPSVFILAGALGVLAALAFLIASIILLLGR